jgi:hypothetical protein
VTLQLNEIGFSACLPALLSGVIAGDAGGSYVLPAILAPPFPMWQATGPSLASQPQWISQA